MNSESEFRADQKHGTATLNMGSSIVPFGTLNLKFHPTKSARLTCTVGSGTIFTGYLSGIIRFNTLSSKWGVVGSTNKMTTFSNATMQFTQGCKQEQSGSSPCQRGHLWETPEQKVLEPGGKLAQYLDFLGSAYQQSNGKLVGTIEASRFVYLAKPAGATRSDSLTDVTASQAYNSTTHVLTVVPFTGTAGSYTGRATLTTDGTVSSTYSYTCQNGKHTAKQTVATNDKAAWANAQGNPLTVHMDVGGPFTVTSTAPGYINFYSVS